MLRIISMVARRDGRYTGIVANRRYYTHTGLTVWGNLQYRNTACFINYILLWLRGGQEGTM